MYIIQHKSQSLKLNSTGQNGGGGGGGGRMGGGVWCQYNRNNRLSNIKVSL